MEESLVEQVGRAIAFAAGSDYMEDHREFDRYSRAAIDELKMHLRGDWHGVFLDGRNEHGSHVLMLPQRSIELEQDEEGDFLKYYAETIISDAEVAGFSVCDAVVATFVACTDDGFFSHYEYAGVSRVLTDLIYGSPEEQSKDRPTEEASA